MRTTPSRRPRQAFNAIFPSTTAGVRTHHLTERRPITFTSTLSRSRRLHNPRSSTYPDREICLNLWDHLCLPQIGGDSPVVSYGGSAVAIAEQDVLIASKAIRIISDPHPNDPQFAAAGEALKAAERINILGFGFAARNVERLDLRSYMTRGVEVYASTLGFSDNQRSLFIHPVVRKADPAAVVGDEKTDVYRAAINLAGARQT